MECSIWTLVLISMSLGYNIYSSADARAIVYYEVNSLYKPTAVPVSTHFAAYIRWGCYAFEISVILTLQRRKLAITKI